MIGLAFTNASPRLAPTGGVERLFGNNPWSIAVPCGRKPPVVLDMANSVVAAGKIRILQKEGKPIPEGWALNEYGEPTTDAAEALRGILLAVGGYKGYGITVMMDLLTGVLADSNYGPRVKGMDQDAAPGGVGHSFMAISLAAFTDVAAFKARMESYVDEIKSSKKARGAEVIYVPAGAGEAGEGHPVAGQGCRRAAGRRKGVGDTDRSLTARPGASTTKDENHPHPSLPHRGGGIKGGGIFT